MWRERIAARLAAELDAKPAYAEFRIIGLEDGGREILNRLFEAEGFDAEENQVVRLLDFTGQEEIGLDS